MPALLALAAGFFTLPSPSLAAAAILTKALASVAPVAMATVVVEVVVCFRST